MELTNNAIVWTREDGELMITIPVMSLMKELGKVIEETQNKILLRK